MARKRFDKGYNSQTDKTKSKVCLSLGCDGTFKSEKDLLRHMKKYHSDMDYIFTKKQKKLYLEYKREKKREKHRKKNKSNNRWCVVM
jgi:hypothetical protein